MLGMFLPVLLSTILPFQAQSYIPGAALATREASHLESDLCREKQHEAKEPEPSWVWSGAGASRRSVYWAGLQQTSVLATKSISPPSLVFAEVSSLFLCNEREFAAAVSNRILIFLTAFMILLL